MKNKRGVSVIAGIVGILMIIVLAGVVTFGIMNFNALGTAISGETDDEGVTVTGEEISACGVSCPSDQTTTFRPRFQIDTGIEATLTYVNSVNVYAIPVNGGELTNTTTTGTTGAYPTGVDLDCKEPYIAVAVDSAGVSGSAVSEQFTACGAEAKATVIGTRLSELQGKIKDNDADAFLYNNLSTTTNTYTNLTRAGGTWNSTSAQGALNITSGTTYDYSLLLKVTTGNNQWGNVDYDFLGAKPRVVIAVDMDVSEYQEPSVTWRGEARADIYEDLVKNDRNVLSAFEYAYEIEPLVSNGREFNIVLQSESGVDPTADIVFRILAEGLYKSTESPDTILMGIFDDSSSQTEIHGRNARATISTV